MPRAEIRELVAQLREELEDPFALDSTSLELLVQVRDDIEDFLGEGDSDDLADLRRRVLFIVILLAIATLVNRAERFLLQAVGQGYTPNQVWSALSIALARWETLQQNEPPAALKAVGSLLRFAGSHDLAMDLLARQLAGEEPPQQLALPLRAWGLRSVPSLPAPARARPACPAISVPGDYNIK